MNHGEVEALLPWFAAGTLEETETMALCTSVFQTCWPLPRSKQMTD